MRGGASWGRAASPPWADPEGQRGLSCALAAHRQTASDRRIAGKQGRLLEGQRLGVRLGSDAAFIPGARATLSFEGAPQALCRAAGDVGTSAGLGVGKA